MSRQLQQASIAPETIQKMYSQPGLTEKEVQKLKFLEEKMKRMEYSLYLTYHTVNKAIANTQKNLKIREKKRLKPYVWFPKNSSNNPPMTCALSVMKHTLLLTSSKHPVAIKSEKIATNYG